MNYGIATGPRAIASEEESGQLDLLPPVAEAFKPGACLVWDPHPGYVLKPHDRVVLATTRQGLGELLGGS
ncbi:hypothetical protein [Streptomyces violaceusniger]